MDDGKQVAGRADAATALAAVAAQLRCPSCGEPLKRVERSLACARGHSYDIARHGHVTLEPTRGGSSHGDSEAMVVARQAFLGGGHYAPIAEAIVAAAQATVGTGASGAPLVVDLGAGTGYHLAALLSSRPEWRGLALDASRPALRRAARAHPRIAAVVCDVWRELPVQDAGADLVLDVFAPRNADEIARILAPEGALVVLTPAPEHLRELVSRLGLLDVGADKPERLRASLAPALRSVRSRSVAFEMTLGRDDVLALIAMGPSAHHLDMEDLRRGLERGPGETRVTASVLLETFRRPEASAGSD